MGLQSLKELAESGRSLQCSYKDDSVTPASEGSFYISGGNLRGDFNAGSATQPMTGHMIVLDKVLYTWIDDMPNGFKLAFDDTAASQNANQGFDANKKLDYSCDSWSPDAGSFTLPTNVTFTEIAQPVPVPQ